MGIIREGTDFTGITCAAILWNSTGQVLMQQRSMQCRDEHGKWEFFGGAIVFGEDLETHVRRETYEECGATIDKLRFLGAESLRRVHPHGYETHWILFVWTGIIHDLTTIHIGDPDKIIAQQWFDTTQLPTHLHSALTPHFLQKYLYR